MDRADDVDYQIVVNTEERHSIWPNLIDVPAGWTRVGPIGDRATCLAWIEAHWTDIRPKSVREDN